MNLGTRLRDMREFRCLTLREVARRCEMSAAYLSDMELGNRSVPWDRLVQLAGIYGMTPLELLGPNPCPYCKRKGVET